MHVEKKKRSQRQFDKEFEAASSLIENITERMQRGPRDDHTAAGCTLTCSGSASDQRGDLQRPIDTSSACGKKRKAIDSMDSSTRITATSRDSHGTDDSTCITGGGGFIIEPDADDDVAHIATAKIDYTTHTTTNGNNTCTNKNNTTHTGGLISLTSLNPKKKSSKSVFQGLANHILSSKRSL